jgi:hypothetical protein
MQRILVSLFALALSFSAIADRAGSTYRAGNKVLSPGDSQMKVLDAMGPPESKEPIQNKLGAQMGEYWYYRDGNKTVKFFMSGGQVYSIEEIR